MIKDLIVKDNFFDNPHKILALAKAQKYYPPSADQNWVGMRSGSLPDILNNEDSQYIYEAISKHIFHEYLNGRSDYSFKYDAELYFHYLDETEKHNPNFFHQDHSLMAGVVYLSENPQIDSGTVILENDVERRIDNVFNRCVLYNSNYFHTALNGFGKTVEDVRLTLTIFFNEVHIIKPKLRG